jgi:hypothetical protein
MENKKLFLLQVARSNHLPNRLYKNKTYAQSLTLFHSPIIDLKNPKWIDPFSQSHPPKPNPWPNLHPSLSPNSSHH